MIHFTVTVTDAGPANATNVSVLDALPSGLTLESAAGNGTYNTSTGVWSISQINASSSATLTLTASVNLGTSGETLKTVASITALDQTNNATPTSAEQDVTVQQSASLTITNVTWQPDRAENGLRLHLSSDEQRLRRPRPCDRHGTLPTYTPGPSGTCSPGDRSQATVAIRVTVSSGTPTTRSTYTATTTGLDVTINASSRPPPRSRGLTPVAGDLRRHHVDHPWPARSPAITLSDPDQAVSHHHRRGSP